MKKIWVLHGPNINLLGLREPDIYKSVSLSKINSKLKTVAKKHNISLSTKQTNSESKLISYIHQAHTVKVTSIIINAAAFTHTSLALRDALLAVTIPFVEVHLSNTFSRESNRHKSYLSDIASGVIIGLGPIGYELALTAVLSQLIHQ